MVLVGKDMSASAKFVEFIKFLIVGAKNRLLLEMTPLLLISQIQAVTTRARSQIAIHGQPGNWDFDEYMLGMYNGMECVLATVENRAPQYRSKPLNGFIADREASASNSPTINE